jgi:hypothetical protein
MTVLKVRWQCFLRCVLGVAVMTALTAAAALAQDGLTACERLGDANVNVVFSGIAGSPVRRTVRFGEDTPAEELVLTPFTVTQTYRASTHPTMYVRQDAVEPGREYLVYGQWMGVTRAISGQVSPRTRFRTGALPDVVNPTAELLTTEAAAEDLIFLRSTTASPSGGTILGTLSFGDPKVNRDRVPLLGVRLRVSDNDNRLIAEVETRENGQFVVANVPTGLTWIDARLPDTMWTSRKHVEVAEAGCSRFDMMAIPNGRIRGRVLRDDLGPIRVDLLPADDAVAASTPDERRSVQSNRNGQFEFDGIPSGRYRLGVNLARPPGEAPYPPTFYPGTVDPSAATEIVVGDGTLHERADFAVGSPLRSGVLDVRLPFDRSNKATICVWDSEMRFAQPGGALRHTPESRVVYGVLEGRRYYVVARVEGSSGAAESEITEVVAVPGRQSITLSANRHAPALSVFACHEFYSRTRVGTASQR